MKLSSPRADTSCFCPNPDKIVVFGGRDSAHCKNDVLQLDINTGASNALPSMHESHENRNSACFVGGFAYVAGGKNSKAHKFSYEGQKWESIPDYTNSDNLNSWTSAF